MPPDSGESASGKVYHRLQGGKSLVAWPGADQRSSSIRRPLASVSCSVSYLGPLSLLLSKEVIELLQSSLVCHRVQARVHPGRCITGFRAAKVSSRGPGRTNAPRAFADPSPPSPAPSPAPSTAPSPAWAPAWARYRCRYLKKRLSYCKAHWCATGFRLERIRDGVSPASGRQKSRRVARGGLEPPRAIRRPLASVTCSVFCLVPSSLPLSNRSDLVIFEPQTSAGKCGAAREQIDSHKDSQQDAGLGWLRGQENATEHAGQQAVE